MTSKIPILLYHDLFAGRNSSKRYAIGQEEFDRQMGYLAENGFRSLACRDLAAEPLPPGNRAVVITFDDGNASDYRIAFPILRKYGFRATFFLTVNWVGREDFIDGPQLREMSAQGMDIQSHSLSHRFLSAMPREGIYKELEESKRWLEDQSGGAVEFLSIPGGFYSQEALGIAEEIGYRGVCNSIPGLNRIDPVPQPFWVLRRFLIKGTTPFEEFRGIVNRNRISVFGCGLKYYLKATPRQVLGERRYYALWAKYYKEYHRGAAR